MVVIAALYFAREIARSRWRSCSLPACADCRAVAPSEFGRVPAAVLLAVIMALSVILGFGGAIGSQVAQPHQHPEYAVTIEKKVDTVRAYTVGRTPTLSTCPITRTP